MHKLSLAMTDAITRIKRSYQQRSSSSACGLVLLPLSFPALCPLCCLQCPDPSCRGDLLAYLNQIKLCSHQLRITSSVKADLRSSVRETVESANALITAAKNLMAAVVQTVKLCYIASKAVSLALCIYCTMPYFTRTCMHMYVHLHTHTMHACTYFHMMHACTYICMHT